MATRNQCKCCGQIRGPVDGPLVTKCYCCRETLAKLYGGSPRTYAGVIGHIEGWAEFRKCSVCGSRDIVAHKASGILDTHWCAQHVGKRVAQQRKIANPFGVFVSACYKSH